MEEKVEEKKELKKSRIKEWIFVIGTIVLVTIASIIAYNYGLKKSAPKESIKVEETTTEETIESNTDTYIKIGYHSFTDKTIKTYNVTIDDKNIKLVTKSNEDNTLELDIDDKKITYDSNFEAIGIYQINNYIVVEDAYNLDKYEMYDKDGNLIDTFDFYKEGDVFAKEKGLTVKSANYDPVENLYGIEINDDDDITNKNIIEINYAFATEQWAQGQTLVDDISKYCENKYTAVDFWNVLKCNENGFYLESSGSTCYFEE